MKADFCTYSGFYPHLYTVQHLYLNKNTYYSKPLPFAGVKFLKNPVNNETTMCKIMTLWENGVRGAKDMQIVICKFMTNKYRNICVDYWNCSWLQVSIVQPYASGLCIFSR